MGIPSAKVRNQGMIEGLNRIGYAAVMLGERELSNGYESFAAMREQAKFPFVSANFVYEDDGSPVVDPYVIQTVHRKDRDIRVALLGLNRYNTGFLKSTAAGKNIVVASPFRTANKVVPELRSKADVVVVLTSLSISQCRQLAKQVEGIDLIIGAQGGVVSKLTERENGVPIVFPGNQGKRLSEIRMSFDSDGHVSVFRSLHYLNRDYPVDPELQQMVLDVLAEENAINRERASAEVPQPVIPAGVASYIGAETCGTCHQEALEAWRASAHSHAFQTLIDHNQDFSAECVSCHTVGQGRKGGFVNAKATPALVDVQCESCHGPGSLHAATPKKGYGAAGARSCLGCHDPENSPEFDFYAFWPKIQH
ncbi:MAG: multiheme c-type cytochrome [Acidobacteriota bacterium]